MSDNPVTVTYTLEQLFAKLEAKMDKLDGKIDNLQKEVSEVKVSVESLKGDIKELKAEVQAINKRLDNQENTTRLVIGGVILTFLASAYRIFLGKI